MQRTLPLSAALALAVLISGGCQRPPEPTAEDIVAYARNGAVGAKVRRMGPPAQAYVDRVFKAYSPWHETFSPVAQLADPKGLWSVDSSKWRDAEAVDTQLDSIRQWRKTESQRKQLHEDLVTAIEAVPAAYHEDAKQITAEVTKLLDDTQPKQLDEIVRPYERLFSLVRDVRDTFDPGQPGHSGLAFRDSQAAAKAHQLWNELDEILEKTRKGELQQIDWALTTGRELRAAALKQKQNIDRNDANAQAARSAIRALDIELHYYDKIIDDAERRKKQLSG
jgi:hypothetical protein